MKAELVIAALLFAGSTYAGEHYYDCNQVKLSSTMRNELSAASQRAGIARVDLHSLSICRQRGDRTLFASWIISRDDFNDGAQHWDEVHCTRRRGDEKGWGCRTTPVRAIPMRFTMVTIPADMPVDEARRLATRGLETAPTLVVSDACDSSVRGESDLKFFREAIAKPGSWTLEAPDSTGKFRLVLEPYFVDFEGVESPGASPRRACWGVLQFLQ